MTIDIKLNDTEKDALDLINMAAVAEPVKNMIVLDDAYSFQVDSKSIRIVTDYLVTASVMIFIANHWNGMKVFGSKLIDMFRSFLNLFDSMDDIADIEEAISLSKRKNQNLMEEREMAA